VNAALFYTMNTEFIKHTCSQRANRLIAEYVKKDYKTFIKT